ncbi:MAG: hypothetical protein NXY57DRAFT_781205 [Lentinula lateritia]|nr:MAG: hypothetical protein NXY57DRAFT_781205 [Lentinula lateritia]
MISHHIPGGGGGPLFSFLCSFLFTHLSSLCSLSLFSSLFFFSFSHLLFASLERTNRTQLERTKDSSKDNRTQLLLILILFLSLIKCVFSYVLDLASFFGVRVSLVCSFVRFFGFFGCFVRVVRFFVVFVVRFLHFFRFSFSSVSLRCFLRSLPFLFVVLFIPFRFSFLFCTYHTYTYIHMYIIINSCVLSGTTDLCHGIPQLSWNQCGIETPLPFGAAPSTLMCVGWMMC